MRVDALAIVPAGGQSRRLEGRTGPGGKAAVVVGGASLLGRVCRVLAEEVATVVVVTAPDRMLPELPSTVEVIVDREPGRGPLVAIRDGLRHAVATCRTPPRVAVLAACDLPGFTAELVRRLLEGVDAAGSRWLVPVVGGQPQVLCSAITVDCLPLLEQAVAADCVSLRGLMRKLLAEDPRAVRSVSEAELATWGIDLGSFADVDTPAELDRLDSGLFSPS
jgi:molybdopterin-guanine dinucleotide biosynthesis protein A